MRPHSILAALFLALCTSGLTGSADGLKREWYRPVQRTRERAAHHLSPAASASSLSVDETAQQAGWERTTRRQSTNAELLSFLEVALMARTRDNPTPIRAGAIEPPPTVTKAPALDDLPHKIEGRIRLNDRVYDASCSCVNAANTSMCRPAQRVRIHQELFNQGLGLSREQLRDLLGNPAALKYVDARKMSFSDIHGPVTDGILGTLGGDFGEFLVGLGELEAESNTTMTLAEVQDVLETYILQRRYPFYYGTSEEAIKHAARNLRVNGRTGVVVGLDIRHPHPDLKSLLLEALPEPDNQGSLFLQSVLTDPARYYLKPHLPRFLIQALHKIIWREDYEGAKVVLPRKIEYVIRPRSDPKTREIAWLNMRANVHCQKEKRAPVFAPDHPGIGRVFVVHPEAADVARLEVASFLSRHKPLNITGTQFYERLRNRARYNLETAASIIGLSVPFYTILAE